MIYIGISLLICFIAAMIACSIIAMIEARWEPVLWPFWPLVLLLRFTHEKYTKAKESIKERTRKKTPSDILAGMISTLMLRHFSEFDSNGVWKHKNLSVSNSHYNGMHIRVDGTIFEFDNRQTTQLFDAFVKAKNLNLQRLANAARAEREMKALDYMEKLL